MVASVAELVQTGRLTLHEELKRRYPAGLLDLFRVGGLGPKKIRVLYRELGVESPADLERACRENRVADLKGFGAKSQTKILEGLSHLGRYQERHLVSDSARVAGAVVRHLEACPAVEEISIAGSLRRARETIGDLDLVAAVPAARRDEAADWFAATPGAQGTESRGETKVQIRLSGDFLADLRLVEKGEFATALHHFTGSKEHNIALRTRAKEMGLTLNEYGLFRGEGRLQVASETQLYERLGLHWVAPELRVGRDELELAARGELPRLIEVGDLRGTFHVHTSWSDGTASLAQMAEAAASYGWEYLGIADHSKSAAYAGGLSPERVHEQWEEIGAWNRAGKRPRIFKGTECDILVDGELDFPDGLLLEFDYVVASVHSRFRIGREAMTARIVRAVSHPCVTFLGHPTGRLLLAREAYEFDLEAVLEAAQANATIVEVNASPHRLDLDWRPLTGWLRRGNRTSIHPDAHSPQGLADVEFGVGVARKAGATKEQVLNCDRAEQVEAFFEARRQRARKLLAGKR